MVRTGAIYRIEDDSKNLSSCINRCRFGGGLFFHVFVLMFIQLVGPLIRKSLQNWVLCIHLVSIHLYVTLKTRKHFKRIFMDQIKQRFVDTKEVIRSHKLMKYMQTIQWPKVQEHIRVHEQTIIYCIYMYNTKD